MKHQPLPQPLNQSPFRDIDALVCFRSIFQDMVSMDTLITKIMNFAQRLVTADRASLFLMDSRTKELYARIFDMGNANGDSSPQAQEIR